MISRWITATTERTLDQHATDPSPAAAHLPEAATNLRHLRTELALAVDLLRTFLMNKVDLIGSISTVAAPVRSIRELIREYRYTRNWIDTPPATRLGPHTRRRTRAGQCGGATSTPVTGSWASCHTDACRRQNLAGHTTNIKVGTSDARLRLPGSVNPLRLSQPDAGIYRDPTEDCLYNLQPDQAVPGH
ncbi:hypothetical protein [Micromonospora parva]|uniref:Uncharacterized protein n=1 Tax=Micromonospora parva TaxID=1464048 RepID=A0ABW6VNZ4_9ACTN|nr:hypothetical protein [Micromonospora parva]